MEEESGNSLLRSSNLMQIDAVKCNYIIYWSGKTGMELVDKLETEDKINDGNGNQIARYFELFEEHISPKSNTLITID